MFAAQETVITRPNLTEGGKKPVPATQAPWPPVSAVVITFNEAANIRDTLSKLYWCDEIIIADSYSTDNTVAICREFNCKVFLHRFEGYGAQKQFAVAKAKNDWVLCLDADEVLSDPLIAEIQSSLFASHSDYAGYAMPLSLVFQHREFLYGKESRRYFLRLFNKTKGGFDGSMVHEKIELDGPVKKLGHKVLHYSYRDIHQYIEKCNRYSSLSACKAAENGKTKSVAQVLIALPFYFLRYYLLELNFLNGLPGFYWSVLSANYHFIKYVKIREYRFLRKPVKRSTIL